MTFDYDQFMADREVEKGGIADPFIAQAAAAAFLRGSHPYACPYECGFECDTADEMDDHFAEPCTPDPFETENGDDWSLPCGECEGTESHTAACSLHEDNITDY